VIKQRVRNVMWMGSALVALPLAVLLTGGCGGLIYSVGDSGAESKFREAKKLGAEQHAPYEYYTAQEHLKKAAEEAAQGDYGDAISFANIAEDNAKQAIKIARKARAGAQ